MANNPQMLIRVAANIDELRKNLAEGKAVVETTTAAMAKLASSFSGDRLVQHASNVTAAINQVGAATLTAAEAGRSLSVLERAMEKLDLTGKPIPPAMRQIAAELQGVVDKAKPAAGFFGDLTGQIQATALGMVSATAIIGTAKAAFHTLTQFVATSVQAYSEAEAAAKKVTAALTSQGRATPDVIQQYNDLATQFQKTTVYGDDLVQEMQALLVEVGQVMPGQMEGALKASTDLAAGLGIDLRNATMLVAKAFSGGGDELGKLKAILGDAYVAGQGMEGILSAIEKKFGGQAQSEIETYGGKVKQLTNDWNNFQEAVGKSIVNDPILNAALRQLQQAVAGAGDSAGTATPNFIELWASFAGVDLTTQNIIKVTEAIVGWNNAIAHAPKAPDNLKSSLPLQFGQNLPDVNKLLDEYKAGFAKAAAEAKRLADAQKEINSSLATLSAGTIAHIQQLLDEGKAESDIATVLKVTQTQVRLVAKAEQDRVDLAKAALDDYGESIRRHNEEQRAGEEETLAALKLMDDERMDAAKAALDDWSEIIKQHQSDQRQGEQETLAALKEVQDAEKEHVRQIEDVGRAMMQLGQVSGGSFGNILSGIGQAIAAYGQMKQAIEQAGGSMSGLQKVQGGIGIASSIIGTATSGQSTGVQVGQMANTGVSAGMMAHLAGASTAASVAFAAYTAGAGVAVIAAIKIYKAMNDGRKAMQEFYKTFSGGADELRTRMLILGDAGEAMWVKLTQQTGKGDKAGAQKITAEIMKALSEAEGIQAAISAAGFKSQDELKATADAAMKVWQTMKDSGKYSADQVAAAWEMAQEAIRASLGETATAQTEANTKALAAIKAMDDEMKSLSDSIAGEAPEEFMGVVERQTRDRIAAIAAQRDAAQKELDQTTTDAAEAAKAAGDVIDAALAAREYHVRVKVDLEGLPGGDSAIYTTRAGGGGGGAVNVSLQPQPIYLDGRELARNQAQHLPSILSGAGL